MKACVAVLVLVGCGDNAPMPAWQSGERMRARVAVADDGFEWLIGWHDSQLDVDCGLATPTPQACGVAAASIEFADPQCSTAVASVADYSQFVWSKQSGQALAYELDES